MEIWKWHLYHYTEKWRNLLNHFSLSLNNFAHKTAFKNTLGFLYVLQFWMALTTEKKKVLDISENNSFLSPGAELIVRAFFCLIIFKTDSLVNSWEDIQRIC